LRKKKNDELIFFIYRPTKVKKGASERKKGEGRFSRRDWRCRKKEFSPKKDVLFVMAREKERRDCKIKTPLSFWQAP